MIPDRIMRKIQRCLALSQSANAHEAGIALRQAQALMGEYGVNQEDIALSDLDVAMAEISSGMRPPRYVRLLESLISQSFGTSAVYVPCRDEADRIYGRYEFIGPRDAVAVAVYAYEVLLR